MKKCLAIILALCIIFTVPAIAADTSVSFDFRNKTSDQELYSTNWNAKTKTLSISDDIEISVDKNANAVIMLPDGATLLLPVGVTLTLSASEAIAGPVLYCDGDLTITGGGTLKVSNGREGVNAAGNLTIEDCTVIASATSKSEISTGIFAYDGDISIKNAKIDVQSDYMGIASQNGDIVIANSTITAKAAYFGVRTDYNLSVTNSLFSVDGGLSAVMCGNPEQSAANSGSSSFSNSKVDLKSTTQNGIYTILKQTYENCFVNVSSQSPATIMSEVGDLSFVNSDVSVVSAGMAVLTRAKINLANTNIVEEDVSVLTVPYQGLVLSLFGNLAEQTLNESVNLKATDRAKLPDISTLGATTPVAPPAAPPAATNPSNPFTDVAPDAYYHDAVLWALENGVTTGATPTTFDPVSTCTRAQVVTFLWRAKGCPEPVTTVNPFTDVRENDYFYKSVLWAYENGITTGVTATSFDPGDTCTSGQVITFLWRANDKPSAEHTGTEYYAEAVAWANANGLLAGTAVEFVHSNLSPRADIVTYLYRDAMNQVTE